MVTRSALQSRPWYHAPFRAVRSIPPPRAQLGAFPRVAPRRVCAVAGCEPPATRVMEAHRDGARSPRRAPEFGPRDAASVIGGMGGARPRTPGAGSEGDGEAIQRRSRTVGTVSAGTD